MWEVLVPLPYRSVPLSWCAPTGRCGWNPLSLLVIMVCSKALAAHQGNHPISYSFLSCCRCAGNTCKLPKQLLWRLEGTRLGILPSPGSQLMALGLTPPSGQPTGGDPASPREGGRKGKHNPPPSCFSCSSREPFQHTLLWLWLWRSWLWQEPIPSASWLFPLQGSPAAPLVLYLPWLRLNLSLHLSVFAFLLCFTGQITQGNWIDFAWAGRKQIFFNFD